MYSINGNFYKFFHLNWFIQKDFNGYYLFYSQRKEGKHPCYRKNAIVVSFILFDSVFLNIHTMYADIELKNLKSFSIMERFWAFFVESLCKYFKDFLAC